MNRPERTHTPASRAAGGGKGGSRRGSRSRSSSRSSSAAAAKEVATAAGTSAAAAAAAAATSSSSSNQQQQQQQQPPAAAAAAAAATSSSSSSSSSSSRRKDRAEVAKLCASKDVAVGGLIADEVDALFAKALEFRQRHAGDNACGYAHATTLTEAGCSLGSLLVGLPWAARHRRLCDPGARHSNRGTGFLPFTVLADFNVQQSEPVMARLLANGSYYSLDSDIGLHGPTGPGDTRRIDYSLTRGLTAASGGQAKHWQSPRCLVRHILHLQSRHSEGSFSTPSAPS